MKFSTAYGRIVVIIIYRYCNFIHNKDLFLKSSVCGADSLKMDKETIHSTLYMNHLSLEDKVVCKGGEGHAVCICAQRPSNKQPRNFDLSTKILREIL